MGLFDFVKDAGKNIGMGISLGQELTGLGYDPKDFEVNVEGGVVNIKGEVKSRAEKEKIILALGNIGGVSQVKEDLTVSGAEDEGESIFYTVKSGDSLSKIAKAHYGSPGKYTIIFEANKPMLEDPNKIYPGQVLRIPPQ